MFLKNKFIIGVIFLSSAGKISFAEDKFNINALEFGTENIERVALQSYLENDGLLAGVYRVDVYLNDEIVETRDINFVLDKDKKKLLPEIKKSDLISLGVKVNEISTFDKLSDDSIIVSLSSLIESADLKLSIDSLRLDITIPQIALYNRPRDYIDPSKWDDGITTLFTNYNVNGASSNIDTQQAGWNNRLYASFISGLNVGVWRVRNTSSYSDADDGFNSISSYVQRDIAKLRSQLTFGDTSTSNTIFDSMPFKGIKIESNNNMLPFSQRGFSPRIRGNAKTNARVIVRQNNYIIYETQVSPGPFELSDLSAINSGSNMEVTIEETDGSSYKFTQASASLPIMLREGTLDYSLVGGKYRSNSYGYDEPIFGQLVLGYGLPFGITAYGGLLGAPTYKSVNIGLGNDLGRLGALSIDITAANSMPDKTKKEKNGMSYRLQYAKNINSLGTSLTLASSRYSTQDFYTFEETVRNNFTNENISQNGSGYTNRRNRTQVNLSQSLNGWGAFYLSGHHQTYWNSSGDEINISAGYSHVYKRINYSIGYNEVKSLGYNKDKQVNFKISYSLSDNDWTSYSMNKGSGNRVSHQLGLNGTALPDDNLGYSIQQDISSGNEDSTTSITSNYRGSSGIINAGYSQSKLSKQASYGLQGSIVAHPYGITLSQPLNESMILVKADDAANLKVDGGLGIRTNSLGYAVIPYATAYRKNRVALNMQDAEGNIEIKNSILEVIPTSGALVLAEFKARIGNRILLSLQHNGKPVPFGATAILNDESDKSIVGENGEVFLSGVKNKSNVSVQWGRDGKFNCSATVLLDKMNTDKTSVQQLSTECI